MTRVDLSAQAANLQRAAGSSATCTTATVESLRNLLLPEPGLTLQSTKEIVRVAKGSSAPSSKPGAPKSKRPRIVPICEDSKSSNSNINAHERLLLATGVVNDTLKALTNATKETPYESPTRPKSISWGRCSSSSSLNVATPRSQTPLQQISANQNITPSRAGIKRHPSANASTGNEGLKAQAHCARIGFACLRILQNHEKKAHLQSLQIEMGMSALVHKLIALGFFDLALKELRVLRRRILGMSDRQYGTVTGEDRHIKLEAKGSNASLQKESPLELLSFGVISDTSPLLPLVTTTQLQILRVIATKDVEDIGELSKRLQLENPSCPTNLLQQQIDLKNKQTTAKVAHQLESLAYLILMICEKTSSRLSAIESVSSAEDILHMQILAMNTRSRWWSLTQHDIDGEKDLYRPLRRFLDVYLCRSRACKSGQYQCAKEALVNIVSLSQAASSHHDQSLVPLYQVLANLGQAAGQTEEANSWLQKVIGSKIGHHTSPLQNCITACQIATLFLRSSSDRDLNDTGTELLVDAAESLGGDLHGDASDLDELLTVVSGLRKSACTLILRRLRNAEDAEAIFIPGLVKACLQLLSLSMRFFVRYLGSTPGDEASDGTVNHYKHRTKLVRSLAPSNIDATSTLGRLFAGSISEEWRLVDTALQDCITISKTLEGSALCEAKDLFRNQSIFASSLSHPYWCRFIHLKRNSANIGEQDRSLRISIDLIRPYKRVPKVTSPFLLRCEQYALLHESVRDFRRAFEAYGQVLQDHICLGLIEKVAESHSTESLANVIEEDEEAKLLLRTLHAYSRVVSKLRGSGATMSWYFDSNELSSSSRLLILDYQFMIMSAKLGSRSTSAIYHDAMHQLLKTLVALCSSKEFPVQRLHLMNRILYLRVTHPASVKESLLLPILEEYGNSKSHDLPPSQVGLQKYMAHLVESLALLITLREDRPNLKTIEEIMRSWSDLLQRCCGPNSLRSHVYDMNSWMIQLDMLIEYLAAHGLDYLKTLALQVTNRICENFTSDQVMDITVKQMNLGLQYIKLGYSGLASKMLRKAQQNLPDGATKSPELQAKMIWHLASAEVALQSRNYISCNDHIQILDKFASAEPDGFEGQRSFDERIGWQHISADTHLLQSRLAALEGRSFEALLFARLGVRCYHQIWSISARRQNDLNTELSANSDAAVDETLANTISELSVSVPATKTDVSKHTMLQTAAFWNIVPPLFNGLLRLSRLFAHFGLYLEGKYYLEQSRKVAEAVDAPVWLSQCLIVEAQYANRQRNDSYALDLLKQAQVVIGGDSPDRIMITLQSSLANCYWTNGQKQASDTAVTMVRNKIRTLTSREYLDNLLVKSGFTEDLHTQIGKLSLDKAELPSRQRPRARAGASKGNTKGDTATKTIRPPIEELPTIDVLPIYQIDGVVRRERASVALKLGDLEQASNLLNELDAAASDPQETALQAILKAELSLRRGLNDLATDPIFNILLESAVSHPSVGECEENVDSRRTDTTARPKRQPTQKPMAKAVKRKAKPGLSNEAMGYIQFLHAAQYTVTKILKVVQKITATNLLHRAMNVLTKATMLLNSVAKSDPRASNSPTFVVFVAELGRAVAMFKEQSALRVESKLLEKSGTRRELETAHDLEISTECLEPDTFQAEYIDIIPESWNVMSITLSEPAEEILITKVHCDKAPFVLRVPLKRQNGLECEEEFGFREAHNELREIVELANSSSQNAGDLSRKGAKTQWWNARSALDARLRDLLNNIENIWLGGFRGIFSHRLPNRDLLARLQRSLHVILDKHLPSRQKTGNGKQADCVALDSHVLQLFVGLGCPSESNDIDDSLMDLLYFVVDILQFNGERNAYDEIDFDSIVIETLDALRHYHQGEEKETSHGERQHTILILDKHLHCFPWESLPCMRGQSISRLPSLACLRKRILEQNIQKSRGPSLFQAGHGLHVRRQCGAFVLNPGGDLTHTQEQFEDPLQDLPGWEGMIRQEPQEADMKAYLANHEVFLYFGHGSGAQYIRSRTIKNIDKCAVALLMGCSSGALTEAGDFESYGTPISYMHAGCPAVLGTLWDVTDKDIDRFSQTVLENWGLFGRDQQPLLKSPTKKTAKQKGKGFIQEVERTQGEVEGSMSLDEAVAQARDSCILKYLNGAAPVVYGVPVFLS